MMMEGYRVGSIMVVRNIDGFVGYCQTSIIVKKTLRVSRRTFLQYVVVTVSVSVL